MKTLACYALTALLICAIEGCGGQPSLQESNDLRIIFVAFLQNLQGYGTFAIQNTTNSPMGIGNITIIDRDTSEVSPASLLKLTCGEVAPGGWEYGVFQVGKFGIPANASLHIEYEHNGNQYFSQQIINENAVWVKDIYLSEDLSALFMYIRINNEQDAKSIALSQVQVNGEKATIADYSVLPTEGEQYLVCLKIEPPKKLKQGERLFVSANLGDQTYAGCIKAFHPFVAGPTQYGKVMRPVSVEFGKDSITLNMYNEADFRKCPAVIENVFLDGKDVANQCVLPDKPFPPDLHNYDTDVRPVLVKNVTLETNKKYRFDIDFKRLEPLRPSPTPDGYFDTQRFSFDVQQGVPFEIDTETGLSGGVCTLYAGLRPRPETTELVGRYNSVTTVDPSIPVYLSPHEGTKTETMFQLAASSDFILTGQLPPLIPATSGKSQKFFAHVKYMRKLPTPWASSVISDNEQQTCYEDLEWLTWGAVGAGSHGVFVSAHEKGNPETVAQCETSVEEMLEQIKYLSPQLGISVHVDLQYSLNQSGIHADFLACGPDHILVVLLNEWSTRSSFQESEPFMAAMRQDVQLSLSLGNDWKIVTAFDPLSKQQVVCSVDERGHCTIDLPCFNNVQTLLLSRNDLPFEASATKNDTKTPSIVFLDNPVVSLGILRPGTERTIDIPIQSCIEKPLTLTTTSISNSNSKPGEVQAENLMLEPKAKNMLRVRYKAPLSTGKSVTNVQYSSPDLPNETFAVYICAEIENPAELSQSMLDFGYIPVGEMSKPKSISIKSSDASANITKAVSDGNTVSNIQIAEDGKSLSVTATTSDIGPFSEEITATIAIMDGQETITETVRCTGHAQAVVYASPPQISLVMTGEAKKYSVALRHIEDLPIQIISVTSGDSVKCNYEQNRFTPNVTIELTIMPEILKTKEATITVKGKVENGHEFSLAIPVTAFSSQTE